jgi:hypothetical protein
MDKTKELGGVNEAAVEQGARMAASLNEAKVAWEGLKNTLTEAFGPVLTELVDGFIALVKAMHDSYEAGGIVRQVFDGIAMLIKGVIEIVYDIGLAFSQMSTDIGGSTADSEKEMQDFVNLIVDLCKNIIAAVVFVVDAFIAAWDLIKAAGNAALLAFHEVVGGFEIAGTALGAFIQVVAKVVWDALHLNWGAIASDWNDGMDAREAGRSAEDERNSGDNRAPSPAGRQRFQRGHELGKSSTPSRRTFSAATIGAEARRIQVQVRRRHWRCARYRGQRRQGQRRAKTNLFKSWNRNWKKRRPRGKRSSWRRTPRSSSACKAKPTFGMRR